MMEVVEANNDRLSWDEYFMALAVLVSKRSPDPGTRVGSVLVDVNHRILGTGYNSTPKKVNPSVINWSRNNEDPLKTKYPYVLHSEVSTILSVKADLSGSTLYSTLMPCGDCAKIIIQSGIAKVVYLSDKYSDAPMTIASKQMLDWADVRLEKFVPSKDVITINLKE